MVIKDKRGFTLLEMLVVAAIFVLAISAMVSIFVETNRAQKRLANSEKLQADTRYVVELIAREIRNNRIDYDFYTAGGDDLSSQPLNFLALRNSDDEQIIFHFIDNKIEVCRHVSDFVNCAIEGSYYNVTPDDISATSMKFFISPNSDPFSVYNLARPDKQPLVTIALTTQSLTPDLDTPKWIRYQTAISSRYYAR